MPAAPTKSDEPTLIQNTTETSLGEHLTPFLVLIGEVCVGYAILLSLAVTAGFAGETNPLVPFWGLLLIMLIFYGVARLFHRSAPMWMRNSLEPLSWLLLSVGIALFFVWENNYAQSISFFSPDWLLALLHTFIPVPTLSAQGMVDAIQVNITPAIQSVALTLLTGIYCWRGYRLKNRQITSSEVDNLLKWGSGVLLLTVAIFVIRFTQRATVLSPQIPAWLCAAFFVCILTTRALTNASYLRRFHLAGFWGSAASQERIIWITMSALALIAVLLAIFLGTATTSGPTTKKKIHPRGKPSFRSPAPHHQIAPPPFPWLLLILGILTIIIIIAYLLWRRYRNLQFTSRRAKQKGKVKKESDELHETLFNWSLFLAQLKALFMTILVNLNPFRRKGRDRVSQEIDDILLEEPAVRSIRQVYRALLKRAASAGHRREKDETPYEFRQRLPANEPSIGQELDLITEAYVQARYSGRLPGEGDVSRVQKIWETLKAKW